MRNYTLNQAGESPETFSSETWEGAVESYLLAHTEIPALVRDGKGIAQLAECRWMKGLDGQIVKLPIDLTPDDDSSTLLELELRVIR